MQDTTDTLLEQVGKLQRRISLYQQDIESLRQENKKLITTKIALNNEASTQNLQALNEKLQEEIKVRIETEKELQQSKRKYRQLMEAAQQGILVTDHEAKLTFANPYLAQMLGYDYREMLGLYIYDLVGDEDRELCLEKIRNRERGIKETYDMTLKHRDGNLVYVTIGGAPLFSSTGEYKGAIACLINISQRKEVEAALRESERRYRTLASLSPVGISHADEQGRFLYVNQRWCEIAGIEAKQSVGEGWFDAIHPDDRKRIFNAWHRSIKRREPFKAEYRFLHKDGTIVWALGESMAEVGDRGEIKGFVATTTDITKHLLAEEQLQQHRLDLAHYSRLNTIGEMASGIAHELNQPLTSIVHYIGGCLKRLQEHAIPKEITDAMARAAHQAERAGEIIHRLKDFLQKGQLTKTHIDINQTILDALSLMDHEITASSLDLQLKLNKHPIELTASKIHIEQVILNIAYNAMEAMIEARSKIKVLKIQTYAQRGRVFVVLSDTGPGMKPEVIKQIFNPFFTTKAMGMGMGLCISRSIIEAHRGQITVKSTGHGTQFTIQLPINEGD